MWGGTYFVPCLSCLSCGSPYVRTATAKVVTVVPTNIRRVVLGSAPMSWDEISSRGFASERERRFYIGLTVQAMSLVLGVVSVTWNYAPKVDLFAVRGSPTQCSRFPDILLVFLVIASLVEAQPLHHRTDGTAWPRIRASYAGSSHRSRNENFVNCVSGEWDRRRQIQDEHVVATAVRELLSCSLRGRRECHPSRYMRMCARL
jgi:hypothetical protein